MYNQPGYFLRSVSSFQRYATHTATNTNVSAERKNRNFALGSMTRPCCALNATIGTMHANMRMKMVNICPSVTRYLQTQRIEEGHTCVKDRFSSIDYLHAREKPTIQNQHQIWLAATPQSQWSYSSQSCHRSRPSRLQTGEHTTSCDQDVHRRSPVAQMTQQGKLALVAEISTLDVFDN